MVENSKMENIMKMKTGKKEPSVERILLYAILLTILFIIGYLLFSKNSIKDSNTEKEEKTEEIVQ